MRHLFKLFVLLLCITLSSCERSDCNNTNPIFEEYEFKNDIYKEELAKEIRRLGLEHLRTWLADFIEIDDDTYLVFYIQNEHDLCAKVMVLANNPDEKLEPIVRRKGKGRFNAEFTDLVFSITQTEDGKTEFVYKSFGRLID